MDADGIALMFWVFVGLFALLMAAAVVECWLASGMRTRRRKTEAYRRYVSLIDSERSR